LLERLIFFDFVFDALDGEPGAPPLTTSESVESRSVEDHLHQLF